MTVIERFADFVATAEPPAEAMAAARGCLLDWLGCAISGGVEAPATLLARALPGDGPVRLLPAGRRDARTAALINGSASHTVEVDDIFSPGLYHPGVVTIPGALALAEAEAADGARLLRAIVVGYETGNRIARAVNPAHYRLWHSTATIGHFGAAASAGAILGLDARATGHALATVASMAAGLRHAFSGDAMTKPLHAGRAAEAGVLAALAAREGVTGVPDMLEAERGFGNAMSERPDWDSALATLGTEWTVTATTVKAHACCGHNFAALDGIAALMPEIGDTGIARIHARVYRATAEICGMAEPRTAAEARFSLPYCAAAMVRFGSVTPAAFSDAALADAELRALAGRVSVEIDPEIEAAFPAMRPASVEITTGDGRRLSHHQPTRRGDPAAALSEAEIAAKFHALAAPVLGAETAAGLAEAVAGIERLGDVRDLPLG